MLSVVCITIIINTSFKSITKHQGGLIDTICPFLYQGCKLFEKTAILKSMSAITPVVISLWLLCAFIITQLFCNYLLSAYINVRYVPIVNTLDDIVNNKQMFVLLDKNLIYLSKTGTIYKTTLSTLANRHNEYTKKLNRPVSLSDVYKSRIFDDLANGRAAFLFNSLEIEMFITFTRHDNHRYTVSKHKYFKNIFNYIVVRNATYGKQLISMYVIFYKNIINLIINDAL